MTVFFPHEKVREFQEDFIKDIQEVIKEKKNLIAHVPTGIGKSAAVLSATLKTALDKGLTIFFITPRHTQHKIVIDTLKEIKKKFRLDFSVVDLVGKKSMCGLSGIESLGSGEFGEYCRSVVEKRTCEYYNNTYTKKGVSVKAQAFVDKLRGQCLHTEELKELAAREKFCPYEIACLVAKESNAIVADYHHILNTYIREALLKKMGKSIDKCIIIIDEAHNVVEKTRDLLSSRLTSFNIERAKKEAQAHGFKDVALWLEGLYNVLADMTDARQEEILVKKDDFIERVHKVKFYKDFMDKLEEVAKKVREKKKRSYAGNIATFLEKWPGPDDSYTRILSRDKNYTILTYECLDPSLITKPLSEQAHSVIMMSGTLMPVEVFKNLYSMGAIVKTYPSPFPKKNRLTLIVPETTTKFSTRSEYMYEKIAKRLVAMTEAIPGNSFIFFPSYALRNSVYEKFKDSTRTIFLEDPSMNKQDRTELLEKFSKYKDTGAILLGVATGSFGEGVDMPGDLLKAVIIVGLPLGKPDLETKELTKYYDKKFGNGMEYGYFLPAFTKCFQNAGRCIRSETDRGVVIYLDERYTWANYFKFFPQTDYMRITKDPTERIKNFFDEK